MNVMKFSLASLSLLLAACVAQQRTETASRLPAVPTLDDMRAVSPALAHNTESTLLGEVWKRPGLSPRDRSLVTLAVLISRNQTVEMAYHFNLALDNGVKPAELSEMINHLAFYSGWGSATASIFVAKDVFTQRGITQDQLPPVSPQLLPINEASEKVRVAQVDKMVGPVSPGLVHYTSVSLFHDLWLRPGLTPRDRSLITVSALIATGQVAQLGAHLNRAMDNGLTQGEASEMLTQLAFYAGWPNVFTAVPVVSGVFAERQKT
ncbi:carboxymuconolactone decarboxylase family protein [Pseudomonas syringae pv. syringae]|uniref:carboxymuconolactone decarboxylase family protein n=1 Tax=Pseudomonas syringae TaxID=317 RepID=UPI0023F8A877|nr:carboxymuconolactone decarboxylase family protein [Pseudomonas syringae]MDF5890336.1 carboxymuconolactone decarboxylase family protein [Pseudomonas syringae pv. syringae]